MHLTPMDIREQKFTKGLRGYDREEVDGFMELAAEVLEGAIKKSTLLEEKLSRMTRVLSGHEERETLLKEAITTAQSMSGAMKVNATKEAELIVSEARVKAEALVREGHKRVASIQDEIHNLKKQRLELQTAFKSILDYHSNLLMMEGEESQKRDAGDEKFRFLQK
ncbi:MAG: DivIVA domain-containing protein [Deltaproteobacteria bacterium]|nr:DivIVA domain-containing protein [Deltaproteobacteria bacterium]